MSKDLVCKKEKIKCKNVIKKTVQKWLTLVMLQNKT